MSLELSTPRSLEYRAWHVCATKQNSVNLFTDKELGGLQNLCNSLLNELNSSSIEAEAKKTHTLLPMMRGLKRLNLENKVVHHFETPESGEWHV